MAKGASAEKAVREIWRKIRRRFWAEEKIRIVRTYAKKMDLGDLPLASRGRV